MQTPIPAVKKDGEIRQVQSGYSAMRLRVIGGNLTSAQLTAIANAAACYGNGDIHLTTRQGVEIPNVPTEKFEQMKAELAEYGILTGISGPRVRAIVACPGNSICTKALINTKTIAAILDEKYFAMKVPYKFKISVTGCPNNCAKARENDLGIMGHSQVTWSLDNCTQCNACIKTCPTRSIRAEDGCYIVDENSCMHCGVCVTTCPKKCWKNSVTGYTVLIGGTSAKHPRFGATLKAGVSSIDEVIQLADRVLDYYKANGQPRERIGSLMTRLGDDVVMNAILKNQG